MYKSTWSTFGIIHEHNPVMDRMVKSTIDKMSFSYVLAGKPDHIQTCEELTEILMDELYKLKSWKLTGQYMTYGVIKDDVTYHIKNLSEDIQLVKRRDMWSYRIEKIVNEHYRKIEELEQKIKSLPVEEQQKVRQAQKEKLVNDIWLTWGIEWGY